MYSASVSVDVGSCGGWWILEQSYTTCSTVSYLKLHSIDSVYCALCHTASTSHPNDMHFGLYSVGWFLYIYISKFAFI